MVSEATMSIHDALRCIAPRATKMLLIIVLFSCPFWTVSIGHNKICTRIGQLEYFPVEQRSLTGSVHQTIEPVSSVTCAQMCHFSQECLSFNFCRRIQRCELNHSTRHRSPQEFVRGEFCTYYDTNKTTPFHSSYSSQPTVMPTTLTTTGICSYETSPMTPYKYTYVLSDVELGTHFRVDFTLRAPRNGNLALSSRRGDQDSGIIYEIVIGGYVNSKSAIRRCKLCDKGQIEVSTVGIVSDSEDRVFWIEYSDGDVSVGRGEAPPLMNQTWSEAEQGERPSTVYLGVSTWRDASGHWIFQNCY